jgi:FkbM family methyltransferase
VENLSGWRHRLRTLILRRGIQAVCGSPDFVSTSIVADISPIGAGWRFAYLRLLGALGVKNFVAKSGLGYDFVCHVGDLAEFPFYHRRVFERELAVCAAWLDQEDAPVVYDVGANVGFVSAHLAQMLAPRSPRIYAFEPAPATFERLVETVRRLGLTAQVHPIAAAVTDAPKKVHIALSKGNSLVTQVVDGGGDCGPPDNIAVDGITLDEFGDAMGLHPVFIKMDVEGSELAALHGAARLLSREDRPAMVFEYNPASIGGNLDTLRALLAPYALYYVDDLRGQLLPFGSPVVDLEGIHWISNLFAAPRCDVASGRWASALNHAQRHMTQFQTAAKT